MIVFQNPGLIDIEAVTTMGVSVKGDNPIGRFGTGVKFGIATVLRHGCNIVIYRGLERYEFASEPIMIRGEHFDRVCMNGESLGFTTMLGRDWQPWMAFRELASNCRDEGGRYFRICDAHAGQLSELLHSDMTTVVVTGQALFDVWPDRRTIMLEGEPLLANEVFEVREGITRHVYFRGVRVYDAPRPLAYTYNIREGVDLTEDRTAKTWWEIEQKIERGIGAIEDKNILRRILTCGDLFGEHYMDVPAFGYPGPVFREMARELAIGVETVHTSNPKAVAFARKSAIEDMREGDSVQLEPMHQRMLDKAKSMLKAGGFDVGAFPIIVASTLGPNICGMAKDGRIFISLLPFQKGTREVAATLLEEYAHLKSGHGDHTPGFQNWLFDQLLIQTERTVGEPF